jgi:hypothetical protein
MTQVDIIIFDQRVVNIWPCEQFLTPVFAIMVPVVMCESCWISPNH